MTAHEIALAIMAGRYRRNFVLPCYTPRGWWECDVYERSAAGFVTEYEIKLNLTDFRADADKAKRQPWSYAKEASAPPQFEHKHELLQAGSTRGPRRFYYVVPEPLLEKVRPLLPIWAGLIVAAPRAGQRPPLSVSITTVAVAPKLHSSKAGDSQERHALGVCYYRLHTEMVRLAQVVAERRAA
jgi:hypothetical protein